MPEAHNFFITLMVILRLLLVSNTYANESVRRRLKAKAKTSVNRQPSLNVPALYYKILNYKKYRINPSRTGMRICNQAYKKIMAAEIYFIQMAICSY